MSSVADQAREIIEQVTPERLVEVILVNLQKARDDLQAVDDVEPSETDSEIVRAKARIEVCLELIAFGLNERKS